MYAFRQRNIEVTTLDKYEYKVRADEIKSLISEGEYEEAVKIADSIDWRRVKSVMMLCTISDLYKINRRYEDSRDILLLAYEKQKGRLIVYSLCELSIKLGEYVQAIEYYKEFVQIAPKDSGRYILQYKLYEAQDVSLEERIEVLEELKRHDYREKWAYELAYLYHRVGLESKCIEECDEMILWFGEGRYVLKAYELKMLHTSLTPEQQQKYEELKSHNGMRASDLAVDQETVREEAKYETEDESDDEYSRQMNQLTDDTKQIPETEPVSSPSDDLDIQVKTVDVSQYNTINLQKELAESMRELLENKTEEMPAGEVNDLMMTQMYAPVEHTESADEPAQADEAADKEAIRIPDMQPVEPQIEQPVTAEEPATEAEAAEPQEASAPETVQAELTEEPVEEKQEKPQLVLRQDTDEMKLITDEDLKQADEEVFFGNTSEVNVQDVVSELTEKNADRTAFRPVEEEQAEVTPQVTPVSLDAMSNTGVIRTFNKKSGYDEILSQEYDGQISLVVPESEKVEKQITGQLSIEDVMAEWERMKKENEERRLKEIRERVRKQTDNLFADFDESTKSGLLEELENAMVTAAMKEEKLRADKEKPKVVKVSDIEKQREEKAAHPQKKEEVKPEPVKEPEEIIEESVEEVIEEQPVTEPVMEEEQVQDTDELVEDAEIIDEEEEAAEKSVEEAVEETTEEVTKEVADAETTEENTEAETKEEISSAEKGRELTEHEKEEFAPFIHHRRTRRQIAEVIDNISLASYTGNVVVTGEEGTEATAFAKLLIKDVQSNDSNFSGKVAKISGSVLNKKDIAETLNKLANGALIVENAASLKKPSVDVLLREMNQEEKGLILVLEDTKSRMDAFLTRNKNLQEVFNLRVDLEALDDQTLVKYARKYALEQEYSIDDLGILALHTRIADLQTGDHEVTLSEIEELVDEAIYYADKKTPKHFFDVLFGNRYDDEDMIILREKDFMHY
jgi:tetratricopeptide (TPR) repeat protein